MDFTVGKELTHLKEGIIAFSKKNLNDSIVDRNRDRVFERELWDLCGGMTLQGLPVPIEYGGKGLDPLSMAIALEGFGYGCEDGGLAFAVAAHLLSCVVPVWVHGSEEQKSRYLPDLCSGKLVCTNAMTEPQGGSAAFDMISEMDIEGNEILLRQRAHRRSLPGLCSHRSRQGLFWGRFGFSAQ
jgi:alkylation response protein AidB-like acyl-CoA dehydrogenase